MSEEERTAAGTFATAAYPFFDEAAKAGFPAFLTDVAVSSPLNATPYLGRYKDFQIAAAEWPGRRELTAALEEVRATSEQHGVTIEAILIGGSFTELSKPAPSDIDCLMLYRQADPARPIQARGLAELRREAKQRDVDVRFLPLDGDPLALVKSLCYLTILFSNDKHAIGNRDIRIVRGLLLLDCRDFSP